MSDADKALRRAWWSLALYPVSFFAAFVVGEGLLTLLADSPWRVPLAATPALLVFVVPGVLGVAQGRRAVRLGRPDGKVPAIIGATIGLGFVGVNLLQGLVGLVRG